MSPINAFAAGFCALSALALLLLGAYPKAIVVGGCALLNIAVGRITRA